MKEKKFNFRKKFVSASFLIALIAFVLLRYYLDESVKAYAWLSFILVPLAPILMGFKKINVTYPLIVVVCYLVIGFAFSWWHPGWVLFLTIPIYYIFFPNGITIEKDDDHIEKIDDKNYTDL